MKVLFVIDSLAVGGAERSLVELLPPLHEAGVETILVALRSRPGALTDQACGSGATVMLLRSRTMVGRLVELRRIIKTERPTIVHTSLYISDQLGRLAAVGTKSLVVSSLVNTTYDPVRLSDPNVRGHRLAVLRLIDGWTARHLTVRLHAVTHAVEESAVRALRVPSDRITVIPRGRNPERLGEPSPERRARPRAALGIPDDAQVVLTVGRHEFQKGQEHLLGAFEMLHRSHPRSLLLLAGPRGRATPALEAMREQSPARDRIWFLGVRDDVPELLAAADVFAFPSRYEGFGGALVEAMALGVPAVVSDIPVLREVVDGNAGAVLVAPADPRALARGIASLLDNPALAAGLAAHARSVFAERFTIARSAHALLEFYTDVASRTRQPARTPQVTGPVPRPPRSAPELTSVVMCVRNEVRDLPEQLMALCAQTSRGPWELIVCDNGSVDGTAEVAAAWRDRLPQLRVIDASACRGLNAARNLGVANAAGDFIAFCDGDDVVSPHWLQALVDAAPFADIVGGPVHDSTGSAQKERLPVKHDFLVGVPGGNCGMWTSVAKELRWDEDFRFAGSDIEFSWRAQLAGFDIEYAPDAVIWARAPEGLPALARQWYLYGASGGKLFREFRRRGMPRSGVRGATREWAWLCIHAGDVWRSGDAQRHWVRRVSYRAGRVVGSARALVLYL
jgi:glycosyltransferase involved in cell wall biosynthesis